MFYLRLIFETIVAIYISYFGVLIFLVRNFMLVFYVLSAFLQRCNLRDESLFFLALCEC